ncbi:hypothetical protein Bca52824_072732 [Brassica carinata]|uniref:Uncharacterized protein n=1 Tax=Brassica carinata TaxID=52824 RepID=A0A8X7QCN9_BRACI|nr:hypothetical protein Bca52824_072732 [Brassica carinata]
MIQASLSVHRPNTFKNLLSEDSSFRFRDYKQLMVFSNTTTDLPYIKYTTHDDHHRH